jgi:hypothetical protein
MGWGWGGSPDGFHGDDSNGYSTYSDCLVCVCVCVCVCVRVMLETKLGGWGFFWEEDPGQFNKICFPNPSFRLCRTPSHSLSKGASSCVRMGCRGRRLGAHPTVGQVGCPVDCCASRPACSGNVTR